MRLQILHKMCLIINRSNMRLKPSTMQVLQ